MKKGLVYLGFAALLLTAVGCGGASAAKLENLEKRVASTEEGLEDALQRAIDAQNVAKGFEGRVIALEQNYEVLFDATDKLNKKVYGKDAEPLIRKK